MPSEQLEFTQWLEYEKKELGNANEYPAQGFIAPSDMPVKPIINKAWKDVEPRAIYNANNRAQRDLVVGFSNKEFIKSRIQNRLLSFQLSRKRARWTVMPGGLLDRLRNSLNETIIEK